MSIAVHPWLGLLVIARPFFRSPARKRVVGYVVAIVVLLLAINGLNVVNSYVGRNFITAISQHQPRQYAKFAALYLGVFAAESCVGVGYQFLVDRLALRWRDWLTGHLIDLYLSEGAFEAVRARGEIDNPDQRIAEDVKMFTSTLLSFGVLMINSVLTTIAFAGVLWSISPTLLLTAVIYSGVGSALTIAVGHRLVGLNHLQLRREADLRYGLIHARHTSVTPSGEGRVRAGVEIHARLREMIQNNRIIIGISRNVGLFTAGYNYLIQLLPILIVAPRYFRGEIEFGVVTQSAMAFSQLLGAFSLIVVQFGTITAFTAVAGRIGTLWEAMDATFARELA